MALSFLYLAFVRILEPRRLCPLDNEDLAVNVVMLRHEVAVLRRQVARPALRPRGCRKPHLARRAGRMQQKERRYLPRDLRPVFRSTYGETRSRRRPRNPDQQPNWGFRQPHFLPRIQLCPPTCTRRVLLSSVGDLPSQSEYPAKARPMRAIHVNAPSRLATRNRALPTSRRATSPMGSGPEAARPTWLAPCVVACRAGASRL